MKKQILKFEQAIFDKRKARCHICTFNKNIIDHKMTWHHVLLVLEWLESTSIFHHDGHGWSAPSRKLMEPRRKTRLQRPLGGRFMPFLCFYKFIFCSRFSVLQELVFTARVRPCLSAREASTSIKLWHFSQITRAPISCFNTVTPESMRVKDTIRD